ncbi:hypothetical protein KA001_01940 [Patescibacteria group bacterium]|nr:hypothetical protein [Patescibacteria group bacterium]
MKKINQKGQATLLAILIITTISIVTAVGVSSRQNAALKRSSYTKQTDQGFACANSAVDTALLCIRTKEEANLDPVTCTISSPVTLTGGACSYQYSVSSYTPDASGILKYPSIQRDSVLQIRTEKVNDIQISWNSTAFLEISHIYRDGGDYKMDKYLVKRTNDSAPSGVTVGDGFSNWSGPSFYVLSSPAFFLHDSESILRIRPYFADALDVQIKSNDGDFATLSQGFKITAKGTAGAVIRNLEVIRTNPQLPAIFDYVLYSEEGSITK